MYVTSISSQMFFNIFKILKAQKSSFGKYIKNALIFLFQWLICHKLITYDVQNNDLIKIKVFYV